MSDPRKHLTHPLFIIVRLVMKVIVENIQVKAALF